jgi:hypothetical protein
MPLIHHVGYDGKTLGTLLFREEPTQLSLTLPPLLSLLDGVFFRFALEYASIKHALHILLSHNSILRPNQ